MDWPLDTISYVTEGVIAATLANISGTSTFNYFGPTCEYLLRTQNADGSWGRAQSPDQMRSPRVVSLLQWCNTIQPSSKLNKAIDRYFEYLFAHGKEYGLKNLTITSGFVGLALADHLQWGITF